MASPVIRLVAPGPDVAIAYFTTGAGIPVGHVSGSLLVAHEDMVNFFAILIEGVVGGQDGAARIAEDNPHTFPHQAFPYNFCAG